ncbi:uncharacterized protein B0I36DRAFT_312288 [Microdochium trichocladiopsis]|uniref:Uncharacterized protein n=1 Tax=Microdochium trichocladiopsis TaxID=1682393 RepID=A0A9P9BWA3_9PEZI|nr:uncharacterized protein B0I36DRAFT_312288 [Microdochium trichocladiopsis]KAH7041173.1 hypothetical protein B0I36DRAFT_312288 [Microdochium trichocladiopsis]
MLCSHIPEQPKSPGKPVPRPPWKGLQARQLLDLAIQSQSSEMPETILQRTKRRKQIYMDTPNTAFLEAFATRRIELVHLLLRYGLTVKGEDIRHAVGLIHRDHTSGDPMWEALLGAYKDPLTFDIVYTIVDAATYMCRNEPCHAKVLKPLLEGVVTVDWGACADILQLANDRRARLIANLLAEKLDAGPQDSRQPPPAQRYVEPSLSFGWWRYIERVEEYKGD